MTSEERSKWAYRALICIFAFVIMCGVWFYREKIVSMKATEPQVVRQKHAVEILHFHLPGQPESETLADHLNRVEGKYSGQVLVTRLDVRSHPERVAAEKITGSPEVVVLKGETRVFHFVGLWPHERIEQRVEEILRGIKRMEKGWMPPGISPR